MEDEIRQALEKYHAVGASVAVVKDNRLVYTKAFGYNPDYCDSTLRKPIQEDGVFVIQSISKTFISTAIMQLVEKRKLKLDDDVNQYLPFTVRNPYYPDIPITIRMLLGHRSTINDKQYGWTFSQINPRTGKKWRECYNDYMPGAKFSYCNFNYNLLGAIIEGVTGERFFDYIDEHIMMPLGMHASLNLTRIDSTRLVRALVYDRNEKRFKKDSSPIYSPLYYRNRLDNYELGSTTACFSPSGGVKTSVSDLAKYMMMHMNYGELDGKKILDKESELKLWKPLSTDTTYALGFFHNRSVLKGEEVIGVRGSAHGVHSAMYFSPEKKFGIVVLCNGCTSDRPMKDTIAWILYKNLIKED